jgi:hypothetical protein
MVGRVIQEHVYPARFEPSYVIDLVKDKLPEEIRDITAR